MSIHPPSSNVCAPPVEDARVSIELQLLVNQVMVLHRIECQEKTPNLVSTDIVALQGGWQRRIEEAEVMIVDRPHTVARRKLRRSEEHTSELQSLMRISYAVFCLNKKTTIIKNLQ